MPCNFPEHHGRPDGSPVLLLLLVAGAAAATVAYVLVVRVLDVVAAWAWVAFLVGGLVAAAGVALIARELRSPWTGRVTSRKQITAMRQAIEAHEREQQEQRELTGRPERPAIPRRRVVPGVVLSRRDLHGIGRH